MIRIFLAKCQECRVQAFWIGDSARGSSAWRPGGGSLRRSGVRIAVDDAGSGYASMRHILNIRPNYLKLDTSLTRGIDGDSMKRALAAALIEFGRQTDCKIVAEGVESEGEMRALGELGVDGAQGFHLARPCERAAFAGLLARQGDRR